MSSFEIHILFRHTGDLSQSEIGSISRSLANKAKELHPDFQDSDDVVIHGPNGIKINGDQEITEL